MGEISKINVNGTTYDIRSSFPTIQMLHDTSSPATDFSGISPYNIYGKIYKINFEIEIPLNGSKIFILKNPEKRTKYEIVSGEGIVAIDDYIIDRMENQSGQQNNFPTLAGLKYSRENDSNSLKLEFTNNTSVTIAYGSTVKYYIEFTLYEQPSN